MAKKEKVEGAPDAAPKSKAGRKRTGLKAPAAAFDGIEAVAGKVGLSVVELRSLTLGSIQAYIDHCPITAKSVARGVAEIRLAAINEALGGEQN